MSLHNVPAWATIPTVWEPIPLENFHNMVICAALQGRDNENLSLRDHLRWLLAYWRADNDDPNRHDRAEVMFYGRAGFDQYDDEDLIEQIWLQLAEGYDPLVPAGVVNNFINWAFGAYINWE